MKNQPLPLVQAIAEFEACDAQRAMEIASDLGFEASQFNEEFEAVPLSRGTMLMSAHYGSVYLGHSGEPIFTEDDASTILYFTSAEQFTEDCIRIGECIPDGWEDVEHSERVKAVQYSCLVRADRLEYRDLAQGADSYGKNWEDGKALVFSDDSVYYANGGRHEVWASVSDFIDAYPEGASDLGIGQDTVRDDLIAEVEADDRAGQHISLTPGRP